MAREEASTALAGVSLPPENRASENRGHEGPVGEVLAARRARRGVCPGAFGGISKGPAGDLRPPGRTGRFVSAGKARLADGGGPRGGIVVRIVPRPGEPALAGGLAL